MLFERTHLSRLRSAFAALALVALTAGAAHAQGVVAKTAVTLVVPGPSNVTEGQHESDTKVTAFMENQSLILTAPLSVDIKSPGTYSTSASLTPGTIPTGTLVNSFYFYSDPVTNTGKVFTGSITFNSDILGLEVSGTSLNNTDALLGLAGTTYPSSDPNRGLELTGVTNSDIITLSSDRRTLTWSFTTANSLDGVRVLTAVPEPTTALPLGLALLAGLALMRRRSSRVERLA